MSTINDPVSNKRKKVAWLPVVLILSLIAVIFLIIYRYQDEKRFSVVRVYGKGAALNLTKNYNYVLFSSGKNTKGALLAEKGDMLGFNDLFIYYSDLKKDSMLVDVAGDSIYFVNGKINSLVISENENLLPWFRTMKSADISDLETLYFNSIIPNTYLPYLKEIARLKPSTALVFGENDSINLLDDYTRHADYFAPRFVNAIVTQSRFSELARWKTAECLYLNLEDSIITSWLPEFPVLKQLILNGDNIKSIDASFLSKNKQLEKLVLLTRLPDYALLEPLSNLQELTITNEDEITDASALKKNLKNLSVLITSGNFTNIESLSTLKKLRWLGLPANTSQQQFNTITSQLSDLQVLEITGNNTITNFAALQHMPNLTGLVITDTVTDKESLFALKNLRYLSLPQKNKQDSAYLQAIEKALPGCLIIPNSGACLGSGWLLLLIPVVLLFILFFQNKQLQNIVNE
jgi:hypothetical protein